MNLGQKYTLFPLFKMLNVRLKHCIKGLLVISVDFKVDVTMTVFGLAESDLVVELSILESLLLLIHDLLDEILSHF